MPPAPTHNPRIYCRHCSYDLRGQVEMRCPECGRGFDPGDPRTFRRRPRRTWVRAVVRVAIVLPVARHTHDPCSTGAWYASAVSDDENHQGARDWLGRNTRPLITIDYILDETLTLLRTRGQPALAIEMGEAFFAGELAEIVLITEQDIRAAWRTFSQFRDKL